MTTKQAFLAVTLALSSLVSSNPVKLLGTERMTRTEITNLTYTVDNQLLAAWGCTAESTVEDCSLADMSGSTGYWPTVNRHIRAAFECLGQSCLIADTAGSTGRTPMMKAEGATDADIKCIIAHNPPVGELLKRYFNKPPEVPKQDTGAMSTLMSGLNNITPSGRTEKGTFTGTCATNILIFAKGTLEPGTTGILVGSSFTSGLPAGWSVAGVPYDADIPGDYCLGLPGGNVAKDVINQAHQKCPNANIFLGGYSQGAMVIRNGLARADDAAKKKVKVCLYCIGFDTAESNPLQGVVTFGDPFNGANILGYDGPIAIFCKKGDGVCTGNFEVAASHMAYSSDIKAAQKKLLEMARGGGDNNCCKPRPQPELPAAEDWKKVLECNGGKVPKGKLGTTVEQWEEKVTQMAKTGTCKARR